MLGLGYDGCNVKVRLLQGGKFIEVRKLADLPAEPFVIAELRVNLSPKNQPELWGQVTDAQVMRLAGLRSLKIVDLRGNVTGASLKVMAHHPGLESLQFEGLNLRADDLRHLRASRLQTLLLPMLHVADPDGLAVLATMPNLRSLQLNEKAQGHLHRCRHRRLCEAAPGRGGGEVASGPGYSQVAWADNRHAEATRQRGLKSL